MAKYQSQKQFAKKIAFTLAGGATGIIVQKVVGDMIAKTAIPNPAVFSTVQLADVALAGSEFVAAYYLAKSPKKNRDKISKFLVGMGAGTVAGEVYQWVALQPAWLALGMTNRASMAYNGSSQGRYNRNVAGSVMNMTRNGLSMNGKYVGTTYPRR